jgi:hypothetical protein
VLCCVEKEKHMGEAVLGDIHPRRITQRKSTALPWAKELHTGTTTTTTTSTTTTITCNKCTLLMLIHVLLILLHGRILTPIHQYTNYTNSIH